VTTVRAILVLVAVATVSAGLLAVQSRAPESVREADPGADATDPSNGAEFTPDQIARHGAYRAPAYLSIALSVIVQIVTLVVLARVLVPRLIGWLGETPGGWLTKMLLVTVFVVVVGTAVALPLSYVRTFLMEHAWGLSTQSTVQWLTDAGRSLGVTIVTSGVAALAFFGLVRAFPRTWWLWGWAAFSVLTVLFTFLWPVVIAPLFNKFTPLEPGALRERVVALAKDADVQLDDVLIADASKRTTAENAYVAGVGSSKRMVLYDTLVDAGDADETAYVAAHELGHEVHDHIWKNVGLTSLALLATFVFLRWLATRPHVWAWAGGRDIADPSAVPLLVLLVLVAGLLTLPVQNAISRAFEREADAVAIELTKDPETAVRVYRRLAFSNLADLRPPKVAEWVLFTHPPIPQRIANVLSAAESGKNS